MFEFQNPEVYKKTDEFVRNPIHDDQKFELTLFNILSSKSTKKINKSNPPGT
jgi:hypothetical protein